MNVTAHEQMKGESRTYKKGMRTLQEDDIKCKEMKNMKEYKNEVKELTRKYWNKYSDLQGQKRKLKKLKEHNGHMMEHNMNINEV